MNLGLKTYPRMKESGIEWLGTIPEHWEVRRLRHLVKDKLAYGANEAAEHTNSEWPRYLRITDFSEDGALREDTFRSLPPDRAADYLVEAGDVLLARSGATVGKAFLVTGEVGTACHAGYLIRVRINDSLLHPALFFAFTQSPAFATWKTLTLLVATIENISAEKYSNLPVPVPPISEQTAISRFLGHMDRRIQHYIRAKEKLIALLDEYKQALIHQAVTGQIDVRTGRPYPEYKESGVEWLGEVPRQWHVQRTKSIFRLRTEKSGVNHGRELLSIYTHIGVRPRKDLEEKGNKASSTDDYWIVKRGDIISNKLLAWMGAIGVSHFDGVTSPAYDILMPTTNLVSDYYHHLFRTQLYLRQFKHRSRGIMDMRLRLYFDQFGNVPVPVPPLDEQRAIVSFYNDAVAKTKRVAERTKQGIDSLREYRTRLVSDVVTGKRDVREAAAGLPDLEPIHDEGVAESLN